MADQPETSKLAALRARHEWLDHLLRAGTRYTERHGDHYAAAITYFSVLALVPLLMIAFAVAGFVLAARPDLLADLINGITGAVPGELGTTIEDIVHKSINSAGAVGVFGLLGALYSGIGWMSNLREALSEQWGQPAGPPAFLKRILFDLVALVGLGLALVVSLAVTAVGSGVGRLLLELVGLARYGWAGTLLAVVGVVLALAANWLVFLWVIARLPRQPVTLRSAAKAALFGAVGFEVIKLVMVVYLGAVTRSPAGAAFGSIIGLLIFVFFTSRYLLFVAAWAATSRDNEPTDRRPVREPAVIRSEVTVRDGFGVPAAVGLLAAGTAAGLLAGRRARRR
ncbi:MAG: inner membrane protein YhjD [Pseudonocardia sp.]|nr:inner membrane protein YhjD [Pseudonocardia sp.]